jgi:hypothetical protein
MNDNKYNKSITVNTSYNEETSQMDVSILFPNNQSTNIKECVHILTSGIMLLVRGCEKQDLNVKSHELMAEIREHMDSEFININSFENSLVNTKIIK